MKQSFILFIYLFIDIYTPRFTLRMTPVLNGVTHVIDCVFTVGLTFVNEIEVVDGIKFQITIDNVKYQLIDLPGTELTVYRFSVPQIIPYIYSILTYTGHVTVLEANATASVAFFPYFTPLCDQAAISDTNAIQIPRYAAIKISPGRDYFGDVRIRIKVYDGYEFNMDHSNWCAGYDTTIPFSVSGCPVNHQPARYSVDSRYIILTVNPVNDKPVVKCPNNTFTFHDGCPDVNVGGGILLSDVDNTELQWARIRISPDNGTCDLALEVSINNSNTAN